MGNIWTARCHRRDVTALKWLVFYNLIKVVVAQSTVNWPTVAISWVFSVVTFFIFIACYGIYRLLRKKKKPKNKSLPPLREYSVQSEESNMTRDTILPGSTVGYCRVPSREPTINRRKSDYISKWCSEHGLSEMIANNLRENGFLSREQVESLRPDDVMTLGLPILAQQVQLRHVLENIEKLKLESSSKNQQLAVDTVDGKLADKEPQNMRLVPGSRSRNRSLSSERSLPRSSIADDSTSVSTPSPQQLSPLSNTSLPSADNFHYPHKLQLVPEESQVNRLRAPGQSNFSSLLQFNGLLSDAGLYDMADHLGSEWRHLAAVLGVSKAQQEHLIHNYPSNTKQQIYEMLRLWRDRIASGEKEQVKAQLAEALQKVKRKDLSDNILREQVHGSDPNLGGSIRMNSVV